MIQKHKKQPLNFLKYIGPGLLVTVGFIDPGNWASNIAAGSGYGYQLLWMVTLSTIMLILLQHNAAHLGIVTGLCLSEAASTYINRILKNIILSTAMLASIATAMAEILGGAIALQMLFSIPIKPGSLLILVIVLFCTFTNAYRRIEKLIILFVSLIGFSFLFEICIAGIDWKQAAIGWVKPSFPAHSMPVIMSVLGAVVMPHNLFLHSEIIQSRQWSLADDAVIQKQLKYEFRDTLFSMIIGWAINSAMILMAAASFYQNGMERLLTILQSPVLCSLLCLEIWHHWSLQSLCCSPGFLQASQPEWQAVRFFPVFLTSLMILPVKKQNWGFW